MKSTDLSRNKKNSKYRKIKNQSSQEDETDTDELSDSSCIGIISGVEAKKDNSLPKFNECKYYLKIPDDEDPENQHSSKNEKKINSKTEVNNNKRNIPTICVNGTRFNVIGKVACSLGWKIARDIEMWNVYWTDSIQSAEMYKSMKRFQKINHFPGMLEICRKDLLARNLTRMHRLFPVEYNIFPKTWCFPADLGDAIAFSKQYKNKTYILKPDQGAQGRGIYLTRTLKDIKLSDRLICQIYIHRPLLIDGYKFDLRVYTLITSVDPLRIFVYKEGLARFATTKYKEPSGHNTSNVFMHLTNYSVNKHSQGFSKDGEGGSKRKFSTLNRILHSEGYDVKKLWNDIDEIIVKTVLSAWPVLKHNYHACFPGHDIMQACFEILGFDILIDSRMKPLILEVNHSPSFHTEEQIDLEVKEALLRDTFNILNISLFDKRKILTEDRKRVKCRLLQRMRRDSSRDIWNGQENFEDEDQSYMRMLSPMSQQIAWEESHLGGFRRIMPDAMDPNRYTPFFILQNQSSIYSDTAASKRREEAAKQLRYELIEKSKENKRISLASIKNCPKMKIDSGGKKRKRDVLRKFTSYKWALPNMISDVEERKRKMYLLEREFLIRSSGILQVIYESFYRHELLSQSDRIKYRELFDKLKCDDSKLKLDDAILETEVSLENVRKPEDVNNNLSDFLSSTQIAVPTSELERIRKINKRYNRFKQNFVSHLRDNYF